MFALRKIFVGTLCALLGVMPVFADSNNNSFVDEYGETYEWHGVVCAESGE